jgi:hypothetical protein
MVNARQLHKKEHAAKEWQEAADIAGSIND